MDRVNRLLREVELNKRDTLTILDLAKRTLIKSDAISTAVASKDFTNVTASNIFNLYNFAHVEATLNEIKNVMSANTEIVFDGDDIEYFVSLVEKQMKMTIGDAVRKSITTSSKAEMQRLAEKNQVEVKNLAKKVDELTKAFDEQTTQLALSSRTFDVFAIVGFLGGMIGVTSMVLGNSLLSLISIGCISLAGISVGIFRLINH